MELSTNELEVLTRLREVMAHGWGAVEVRVQDGTIWTIDAHKQYRPNEQHKLRQTAAPKG